jgi:membrane protease subunit HflC
MRNPTPWILGALAALLLLMSSVFVVNEAQTAIVLNLGKIVRTDLKPGLHFKLPLVEEVRKFDRRLLSLDAAAERYLTAEKKDVEVDFFVKWRISDVSRFYISSGGNEEAARARLLPMVKNALRNEINQRDLQSVVSSGRADLTSRLLKNINAGAAAPGAPGAVSALGGASTLGIEVIDVRIKRINLPQDSNILESVFDRMRADRLKIANQLRAEGTQAAEGITADAERQRLVILSEAERDAQTLRGEGDARAAAIGAGAYGQDAEFYAFYRSLEAYRATLGDGKTVMVLDPDSEFLRYFGQDGR